MIHLYSGEGKGKTTASIGLTIRAASYGIPIIFAQFLKDDSSGEIRILRTIEGIKTMHSPAFYGFVKNMTTEQKADVTVSYGMFLEEIFDAVRVRVDNTDGTSDKGNAAVDNVASHSGKGNSVELVVVLDEILHAINYAFVDERKLLEFMGQYKSRVEFVLTGRNPSKRLIDLSDYYTMFKNVKHVYDDGIAAREGIEY